MDEAPSSEVPVKPTREFGMRPLAPAVPSIETDAPRRRIAAAAVGVALLLIVGAGVAVKTTRSSPHHAHREPMCSSVHPVVPAGSTLLRADIAGRGCVSDVVWESHAATATVGGARYGLGRNSDRLVIGDWDGDGVSTPALYRPADGRVFLFASWAGPGARVAPVSVAASNVIDGRPIVVSAGGRRQRVEVRPGV